MKLSFGKHAEKEIEQLLIQEPQYIQWMMERPAPSGPMLGALKHVHSCLDNFDAKPFLRACSGTNCPSSATRFSIYRGSYSPWFWCSACSPYSLGAIEGRITVGATSLEAVAHVKIYGGTVESLRAAVDALVNAKGVPKPRRINTLRLLFGPTPPHPVQQALRIPRKRLSK